ncbi:hypothetical protein KC343_g13390 [Hortaea werneckii]|nr:hypothetical protein KC352_g24391 [Hortaea werneckii]KAI7553162.1 hypothetical protein KC317_g13570 [Hortaea werneckii]KAI7600340.1 hypothetical protein KC346_g13311 [Hortaea werneckii]KAI7606502.1 hypothetical protein KC343_g13390 [Hortaea werneckii]KAI7665250.1 hypothetical protein KC319_g7259 [Hortaea werneckii]
MADSKDFGLEVTMPKQRSSSFVPVNDKTAPEIELKQIHQGQSVEINPPPYDTRQEDEERRGSNISGVQDKTHRKLKPRHFRLIGIGGTIGTALYVQIGRGLLNGVWRKWSATYQSQAPSSDSQEDTWMKRLGSRQDGTFSSSKPFSSPSKITACNVIIHYWSDVVPAGGIIAIVIVLYALINLLAVKWYGETEFWAALGKVLLIVGLILFTFVTMLGGNPLGDRFGFRYWNNSGSFKPLYYEGSLGRWLGFLQCLIQASFTIAGPDYVPMAAGEAENPRVVMPKTHNAVFYRLLCYFSRLSKKFADVLLPHRNIAEKWFNIIFGG